MIQKERRCMINRTSALITNYKIGSLKVDEKITLTFQEIRDLNIKQIAAWPLTIESVNLKLANIISTTKAPGFNQSLSNNNKHILRIEPLKWWVIGDENIELESELGTDVDFSHAFTSIEIKGDSVKNFLNRHLPLDLRDRSFPVNSTASSAIHHVSIKIWRTDIGYKLFIPRGFALSIWKILLETAAQFGYEIL
jgi:heterotetrameric sarcosine oxidase gamma subunit